MKKQNKNTLIARTMAISISMTISASVLASESTLTRSSGAPVGNNQDSMTACHIQSNVHLYV